jgi:hypothetical protein
MRTSKAYKGEKLKKWWISLTFSDKLAASALFLALVGIALSVWTAFEQGRQWRATSLARVEVVDVGFIQWRTLSLESARSTKWGYRPIIVPLLKDRLVTDDYVLVNRVVARDRKSRQLLESMAGVTTVSEVIQEIERRGIEPSTVELQQHFQIEFSSQNLGQSVANGYQAEILCQMPDTLEWRSQGIGQPVDLGPGRRVQNLCDLYLSLAATLPQRLRLKIRQSYATADGKRLTSNQSVYYLSENGAWNYGE